LGVVGETGLYFHSSGKCNGGFWPIRSYILTSRIGNGWSSGSKTSLTSYRYFCRYMYFLSGPVSGLNSTSRSILIPRPSRARDLVTMVEAGPAPGRHNGRRISFPGHCDET